MSLPRSKLLRAATLLATAALFAGGCARLPWRRSAEPREHIHALLLNGGGRPEVNYQSHLQNVRSLVDLLRVSGVPPSNIAIFSGDGSDPTADLATRDSDATPDYWLLPQRLGRYLRPTTYENSAVDGFVLRPATKTALQAWFAEQARRFQPGDTLLLYVTDHGEENKKDLDDNTITLWQDSLSVTELRELLRQVDPGVRIVMLMSQCFGGSFANAIFTGGDSGLPSGNVCGYFATTADRPAYGCYPENLGKDGIGHSFDFFQALQPLGRFPEVQRRVLVTDDTPDVPFTTSDFYLQHLLRNVAQASGRDISPFADELLAEAWRNRGAWEPDIRLLDRIGHTFGTFSPRSLAELDAQAKTLPELSNRLHTYAARWHEALDDLRSENLRQFAVQRPDWQARLAPDKLRDLDAEGRRQMADLLLAELVPFTRADPDRLARLRSLRQKAQEAEAASYRAEVRLGAVLRMRAILSSVAGRVYLTEHATREERQAFERLVACQELQLSPHPQVASAADLTAPKPYPPLADEERLLDSIMPAWMGIQFQPLQEVQRKRYRAADGAVMVITVFPESPAHAAGLRVGDIILGPPGAPFREPRQVREWTMRSEVGKAEKLAILRDGRPRSITLRPGPYPLELPKLPGPPKVGSVAPPVQVDLFRGATKLVANKPRLLFFWATWCTICHSSLPELLAYSKATGVELVAITDEDAEVLKKFFHDFHEPFPAIVATDPYRATFQSYGVSGTPTFVLIGADGKVQGYQTGYNAKTGLSIEGWHWQRPS